MELENDVSSLVAREGWSPAAGIFTGVDVQKATSVTNDMAVELPGSKEA